MKVHRSQFKMCVFAGFLLFMTDPAVSGERHSLTYIYSALSKPVYLPGIHEFSAMGLLDGRMIDYFDSEIQKKVPKEDWMKERLSVDYWEKGTKSRLSKQQWFNVSINTLMKRMRQDDSDVHVLQWMVGCEGDTQPDGRIEFQHGMYMYSYDGNDFLAFDNTHSVWVAPVTAAIQTKTKWDIQVLKEYIKGYLEKECIEWLSKFMVYGLMQLKQASPPQVFLYAKNARVEKNIILMCLATGFYPQDIILQIKRNGRFLTAEDGLVSSGVRPNDDHTFQRRDSIEILKSDVSSFTCEVKHEESGVHVMNKWDHKLPQPRGKPVGPVVAGLIVVIVMLLIVGALLVVCRKRWLTARDMGIQNLGPDDHNHHVELRGVHETLLLN